METYCKIMLCAEKFDNNERNSTALTEVEELQNQIEQLKKDKISLKIKLYSMRYMSYKKLTKQFR